jgi:hypothetical protein
MVKKRLRRVRGIVKAAVLGTAAMVMIVGGVIVSARRALPALDVELPPYFQPGKLVPHGVDIGWDCDYWNSVASCTRNGEDGMRYYVSYNTRASIITRVSKWVSDSDITIGDLVLAWGQPLSTDYSVLSWGNRTAFALGGAGLTPFDKVYFVSYTLTASGDGPWRGFVNEEPYPPLRVALPALPLSLAGVP